MLKLHGPEAFWKYVAARHEETKKRGKNDLPTCMASVNAKHRTGSRKSVERHRVFVHFQQPVMYVPEETLHQYETVA